MTGMQEFICSLSARIPGSYLYMVRKELGVRKKILDVGCGNGVPMYILAQGRHLDITGVDIFPPSVQAARNTGVYTTVVRKDVRLFPYEKKHFDIVVSMFVLEHLKKSDGIKLLARMEKAASEKVVIVIPMGACEQHAYEGNAHQEHLSEWYADDFQKRGYRVVGQGLTLYDQNPIMRKLLVSIGPFNNIIFMFHILFQPFIATRYQYARHLICVKTL